MKNSAAMRRVFGRSTRIFIPVIHYAGTAECLESIRTAKRAGADGVCLIDQGIGWRDLRGMLPAIRRELSSLPLGLNLLGAPPRAYRPGQAWAIDYADFHWTDHRTAFALDLKAPWFGGVAFKTEGHTPPEQYPEHVAEALYQGVTVAVTSGPGTGHAAPVEKVRAIRQCLDTEAPRRDAAPILGLASGVTVDNAADYLPWVDVWLVASGIERSFGVLDPERTERLAAIIHSGAPRTEAK